MPSSSWKKLPPYIIISACLTLMMMKGKIDVSQPEEQIIVTSTTVKPEPKTKLEIFNAKLREKDNVFIDEILKMDVNSMSEAVAKTKYLKYLALPAQSFCKVMKRIGGIWTKNKFWQIDCDKFVCLDSIIDEGKPCLIYSFGIRDDWTFEDTMDTLGCEIHAYDHTVKFPATRGQNTHFHKTGLGIGSHLETLEALIKENNHTDHVIEYLKIDIEGGEFLQGGFDDWFKTDVLRNINQVALEIHTGYPTSPKFKYMLTILQKMYKLGFRLISQEVNMITGADSTGYYRFIEVVFLKDKNAKVENINVS